MHCVEHSTSCLPPEYIDLSVVTCLAQSRELPAGIRDWEYGITHNVVYETEIWWVRNQTFEEPLESGGDGLRFDARTGELLEEFGWGAIALTAE